MKQEKGFIKYFVIMLVILGVVFFSQQAYSKKVGQNLIAAATSQGQAQLAKGSEWVNSNVISKISGDVQKRGEIVKNGATQINPTQGVKNISENILQKVGNYFSDISTSITKPGTPQNCPSVQTPSK